MPYVDEALTRDAGEPVCIEGDYMMADAMKMTHNGRDDPAI
jgi:hypothetical protein